MSEMKPKPPFFDLWKKNVRNRPALARRLLAVALLAGMAAMLTACFGGGDSSPVPYRSGDPIAFDLDDLDDEGRYEPSEGKPRHLPYEFCIPAREDVMADVSATDPSALCTEVSPGTAGCGEGEMLCVGNTRQTGFREVLQRLAAKPFIREIRPAVSP
jgi:hypothetical protein